MMPSALPKSFVVSVFPVPAGPAGPPPMIKCKDYKAIYEKDVIKDKNIRTKNLGLSLKCCLRLIQ